MKAPAANSAMMIKGSAFSFHQDSSPKSPEGLMIKTAAMSR